MKEQKNFSGTVVNSNAGSKDIIVGKMQANDPPTSIETQEVASQMIHVFPNPSTGLVNIQLPENDLSAGIEVALCTPLGNTIYQKKTHWNYHGRI